MQVTKTDKALAVAFSILILLAFIIILKPNNTARVSGLETSGVGVYSDSGCTKPVSSIEWGILTIGSWKNTIVYIRNEAGQTIYLNMSTSNWTPINASKYLRLKWDYSGQLMNPNAIRKTTLTLSVSSQAQRLPSFSFQIVITYSVSGSTSVIFADGFESASFSKWTGRSVSAGETRYVVNTRWHHGHYSARFTSNGSRGTEYAYCYKNVASLADVYARGYFYVSKSGIVDSKGRFYMITLRAGSTITAYAGWRKTGGLVKWCLVIKSGTTNAIVYSTATPSLNKWYCVELHWKNDPTNGLGELWVDGKRVCTLTGKNTAAYGKANQIRFGLPAIYYCASTTLYLDCSKTATSYIGPEP